MKNYTLKVVTTSTQSSQAMRAQVLVALGRHGGSVSVIVHRFSQEALEIEIQGDRDSLDAAHLQLSKDFAAEQPFVRILDELGDDLRSEAYPLLGRLEQELRGFINEAMIAAGMGVDWLDMVSDDRIASRIQNTFQKGQSAIYQHPVEFTELDHLLDIVTVDLSAWPSDKSITAEDLLELLENGSDLKDVQAKLIRRMEKRSFWDVVFSSFFDDLSSWQTWKSRWKKEVIGLRNRVMHHRPVFGWEVVRLTKTSDEFTELLREHRKSLSAQEKNRIQLSARELIATFRSRRQLHEAMGGTRYSGISVAPQSGVIFLFCLQDPRTGETSLYGHTDEQTIHYEGESLRGSFELIRANRAVRDHVADGRELHVFTRAGIEIQHCGRAEYKRHFFSERYDGTPYVVFELSLKPADPISY